MRPRPTDKITFAPDGSAAPFYFDASTGKMITRSADNTGWVYAGNGAAYDFQYGVLRGDYPDNQLGMLTTLLVVL